MLVRNRIHGLHEFLVLTLGIIDQRNRWLGNVSKVGCFARMIHAEFKDG
jgi:hypothetical protein